MGIVGRWGVGWGLWQGDAPSLDGLVGGEKRVVVKWLLGGGCGGGWLVGWLVVWLLLLLVVVMVGSWWRGGRGGVVAREPYMSPGDDGVILGRPWEGPVGAPRARPRRRP